jgi:hypothetical protein
MSDYLTAESEIEALEWLHDQGLTDGLPVVIPTPERVDRLVLATGQPADLTLGTMGPAGGAATIEKVAVAAVMAGCLPDHMPVIVAAVQAILDDRFDLTEMQATTHCTAPLMIVNGPARVDCGGIAASFGALGPGFRANASIGRALRLTMMNIGGARPGVSDMALLGHPGKFSYCLAEDEEVSPFPPLHVALGFDQFDSVVTVVGAEAPHSVMYSGDADAEDNHEGLLRVLAIGLGNLATNNAILTSGTATVVLNPEHAQILAEAGLSREDICQALYERCRHSEEDIAAVNPGFSRGESTRTHRSCFTSPDQILLMVAGGAGLYSMVMPSWCAGHHRNSAVSRVIELDAFCEIPV